LAAALWYLCSVAEDERHLRIESGRDGDTHVIALHGELDLASTPALDRELSRVGSTDASMIVVDLSGLSFLDSVGLGALLKAQGGSEATRDRFALRRGPSAVQKMFEITGMDRRVRFLD
jgi:anti-sigma B factor antagonist